MNNSHKCTWSQPVSQCPIEINKQTPLNLHHSTRAQQDCCYQKLDEYTSQLPGSYALNTHDSSYVHPAQLAVSVYQQPADQGNANRFVAEECLTYSPLTNLRQINQLFTRPYVGWFQGPGQSTIDPELIYKESYLQHGELTKHRGGCQRSKETSHYRFNCLPQYGNPQRVEHVVEPWTRGGMHTRDHIRQVNREYHKKQN